MIYEAIDAEPGGFADAVAAFRAGGGRGLNITLPFKREAFELCSARSPQAERAGAVNTLSFVDGGMRGDNTDGVGLVRDLRGNLGIGLRGRRVLLLGAGGAARGVLGPLLDEGPAEVVVANRTVSRGRALCADFEAQGSVRSAGFDALAGSAFDVVINATSASVAGELPPVPASVLGGGTLAYDLMYASAPTAFVRWAETGGAARAVDGLGMLVEQAAESFYIWRGVRPDTAPVLKALRRAV